MIAINNSPQYVDIGRRLIVLDTHGIVYHNCITFSNHFCILNVNPYST